MSVVLGLDIGGANLKAATSNGWAHSVPFPLWAEPQNLTTAIHTLLVQAIAGTHAGNADTARTPVTQIAVTMTGELADCYSDRKTGVAEILAAVQSAVAAAFTDHRPVIRVWQTTGQFAAPEQAAEHWLATAAANWHALATFVGRHRRSLFTNGHPPLNLETPGQRLEAALPDAAGLLLDIGSTTCDIIPISSTGNPATRGRTDSQRLMNGELVYTGIRRTPIMALLHTLQTDMGSIPLAAERFATIWDAWLLLGLVPENPDDIDTADGRGSTKLNAHRRLARMLCTDAGEPIYDLAVNLAAQSAAAQLRLIANAANRSVSQAIDSGHVPGWICLSGSGGLIAEFLLGTNTDSVSSNTDATSSPQGRSAFYDLVFFGREGLPPEIATLRCALCGCTRVSLADALSPPIADAACAYAVAKLAYLARE